MTRAAQAAHHPGIIPKRGIEMHFIEEEIQPEVEESRA